MTDLFSLSAADLPLGEREILSSLGCPADAQTSELRKIAHRAIARARELAHPTAIGRRFPLDRQAGVPALRDALLPLPGKDIAAHLDGCRSCLLLAVTLGTAVERELHRLAASPTEALYFDAACSILVEAAADAAQDAMLPAIPHGRITFRYSPGYGDLPLSIQSSFLSVLDAPRRIGLMLTDSGLMIPRKSITGIVGIREE